MSGCDRSKCYAMSGSVIDPKVAEVFFIMLLIHLFFFYFALPNKWLVQEKVHQIMGQIICLGEHDSLSSK